jgi:hypothetical protein
MKYSHPKRSPSNSPKLGLITKSDVINPIIPPELPKSDMLLFCFDWDETLVKGHLHKHISSIIWGSFKLYTEEDKNKMVDNFLSDSDKGWRNKNDIIELFLTISELGHHLAITSFCSYHQQIYYALTQLDLPSKLLDKIHIENSCQESSYSNKNEHIEKSMEHFAVDNKTHVILIDNDWTNLNRAKNAGVNVIIVREEDDSYLSEIRTIIANQQASSHTKSAIISTTVNPSEELPLTRINQDDIDLQGIDNENN